MSSWSQQRRVLQGGIVVLVVVAGLVFSAWRFLYKAPTCFDGLKNGSEQGVDCGGACQRLCPSAFLTPQVPWTRFERVASGLYNVAAYIVNNNVDGEAFDAPYHIQLFDTKGILITEYDDTVTLPPHRNTLAFRGAVNVEQRIPAKAVFTWTGTPNWHKQSDRLSSLMIVDKNYHEDETSSSLTVTLKNTGVSPFGRLSVYAILYDQTGNTLGFSKTVIDRIAAGGSVVAPFTWPTTYTGAVISNEILPVAE